MSLSIQNDEAERLARLVAEEAGESVPEAVEHALRERLERLRRKRDAALRTEKLKDILRRVDTLPTLDNRTAEEILGYDEHGLPR